MSQILCSTGALIGLPNHRDYTLLEPLSKELECDGFEFMMYSSWLWEKGHIRHYHVNDYDGRYMEWAKLRTLPIGKGHIDFNRFFSFVKRTGYEDTFTVEATAFGQDGAVDVDMLNSCFLAIRQYLA